MGEINRVRNIEDDEKETGEWRRGEKERSKGEEYDQADSERQNVCERHEQTHSNVALRVAVLGFP